MISKRLFTCGFIMILTMTMLLCMAGTIFAEDLRLLSITDNTIFDKPSDFNYKRDDWFSNDPNNILPWPDPRISNVTDNTAYTSLFATPGHAGQAMAQTGVSFQLNLIDFDSKNNIVNYDFNAIKDRPVTVTFNASYNIMANYTLGTGSGNAAVYFYNMSHWFDWIGYETRETGTRSGTVNLKIETTIGQLPQIISSTAFSQAHSAAFDDSRMERINTSAASVTLNSIKISPKSVYGLFIGVQETQKGFTMRGDLGATQVGGAFNNIDNLALKPIIIPGNVDQGADIPSSLIARSINAINKQMKPGDTFLLYISSHGSGPDTFGQYSLKLGSNPQSLLYDYDLADDLANMNPAISKWVVLDACHSGGFWDKLKNVHNLSLLAACAANKVEVSDKNGLGIFDNALFDAFGINTKGNLNVDTDGDGQFTFIDLDYYVEHWPGLKKYTDDIVYEKDFGDPSIFTMDDWNPVGFYTNDFVDGFAAGAVPIPSTVMLFASGLFSLAAFRCRKFIGRK